MNCLTDKSRDTIFYPGVAAMSLFVNILIHPVSEQAHTDAKWLGLASKIIGALSKRACSRDQRKDVHEAGEFVAELLKLTRGAIPIVRSDEDE